MVKRLYGRSLLINTIAMSVAMSLWSFFGSGFVCYIHPHAKYMQWIIGSSRFSVHAAACFRIVKQSLLFTFVHRVGPNRDQKPKSWVRAHWPSSECQPRTCKKQTVRWPLRAACAGGAVRSFLENRQSKYLINVQSSSRLICLFFKQREPRQSLHDHLSEKCLRQQPSCFFIG